MPALTFNQLIEKYGEVLAWHCLAEIERAAKIQPQVRETDPEIRLSRACSLQDQQASRAA